MYLDAMLDLRKKQDAVCLMEEDSNKVEQSISLWSSELGNSQDLTSGIVGLPHRSSTMLRLLQAWWCLHVPGRRAGPAQEDRPRYVFGGSLGCSVAP